MNVNEQIHFRVCRSASELATYACDWDLLLPDSPQRSPFLSYAWVSSYLEHRLQEKESWYVIFAHEGNRLIGVLPIVVTPNSVVGFSRPILRTPYDVHTLGGDALIASDAPDYLLVKMLEAAEEETPNRFVFKFSRVSENSPTLTSLFNNIGLCVYQEPADIGSYIPVNADFDTYFSSLSKSSRKSLRLAKNRIKKFTKLEIIIKEGNEATNVDLARFMNIEASGWKGREGSAIECSPELKAFYMTLTQRLSNSGMLRWEFFEADGHTLAANLSVRFGDVVAVWKTAYDEDYSKYSPTGVLFNNIIERAFSDDGIKEFNYITGPEWLNKWNPLQRSYFNLYLYPRSPLSYLFGYAPRRLRDYVSSTPAFSKIARYIRKWQQK